MKITYLLLTIFSLCLFSSIPLDNLATKDNTDPVVKMLANNKLRYIELSGTPYERGYTHGKLLKKDIHDLMVLFKQDIATTTKEDPDQFIEKFLQQTAYEKSVKELFPDLLEEVKGIADGAEVDYKTIFMHQLGDEYWFNAKDIMAHNCSSLGVDKSPTQPSRCAQNMDIPEFFHGFQTVMRIKDSKSDLDIMLLTIPGHLGITGMNRNAVSINCNTLMQLDYAKTGIPVTFVVRGVVKQQSQKDALQFLKSIKHASGQNYIIGGPERVHSMECSTNQVKEFRPFETANYTYHTNHPMSNADYSEKYLSQLKQYNKTPEEGLYQCQRILSFQNRFKQASEEIDLDDIKEVLSSRDNNGRDVISNAYTYASVIYELSDKSKFIIAPGKPHEEAYIEIEFE